MSTYRHFNTGQASMPINTPQERFGLDGMEDFYITFKEKRIIHAKAQFDAKSFKLHAQISTTRLGCVIGAHLPYQLT
ncbi:hypothetical protein HAX54_014164, partial [Datura stramonium]|nr:hypothetical protein [Datura stramonium]